MALNNIEKNDQLSTTSQSLLSSDAVTTELQKNSFKTMLARPSIANVRNGVVPTTVQSYSIPAVISRVVASPNVETPSMESLDVAPPTEFTIPEKVKIEAAIGNEMHSKGFKGSTSTGINRGKQLANNSKISIRDLADMRTWFARHGPDASNGGTSYPKYRQWVDDGKPLDKSYSNYRGAKSWLLWGGDAAYRWLKTPEVRASLAYHFPKRKEASPEIRLSE